MMNPPTRERHNKSSTLVLSNDPSRVLLFVEKKQQNTRLRLWQASQFTLCESIKSEIMLHQHHIALYL